MPPASGARGALRVLDALVRWYRAAARGRCGPGGRARPCRTPAASRLAPAWCWPIRTASRRSPEQRWPALAQHHEVIVLLLADPLELAPPPAALPFSSGGPSRRTRPRRGRRNASAGAGIRCARSKPRCERLPARGVRVQALSTDAAERILAAVAGARRGRWWRDGRCSTAVLRDIHLPPAPPWWPPAPGWWLLAAAVLAGRDRRRRSCDAGDASSALPSPRCSTRRSMPPPTPTAQVAAMSELLRRAARRRDAQADRLQGDAWLRFLDGATSSRVFAHGRRPPAARRRLPARSRRRRGGCACATSRARASCDWMAAK